MNARDGLTVGGLVAALASIVIVANNLGEAPKVAKCENFPQYVLAENRLKQATTAQRKRQFGEASHLADDGLAAIDAFFKATGEKFDQVILDDTGLLFESARAAERKGDLEYASTTKVAVLKSRIYIYGTGWVCGLPDK